MIYFQAQLPHWGWVSAQVSEGPGVGVTRVGGPWTSLQDQAGKAALPYPVNALFLGFPLSRPPFRDKTEDDFPGVLRAGSPGV